MARIHAKSCKVFVDQFDFSGVSNSVEIEIPGNLADVTAFLDTDATFVEGKPTFNVMLNGLWSTASPNFDGYLFTNLAVASRRVGIYIAGAGATENIDGYEFTALIGQSPRIAQSNTAIAANVRWGADIRPVSRTMILDLDTAVGASANGTAMSLPAISATQEAFGILRLLASPAGAGNNTLDIKIQSSADEAFTIPNDRLTFTQLNQASTATYEVKSVAGAIADTWWRVVYTYAGAGSRTFSLVIATGFRALGG